jgi:hypothetical protein
MLVAVVFHEWAELFVEFGWLIDAYVIGLIDKLTIHFIS